MLKDMVRKILMATCGKILNDIINYLWLPFDKRSQETRYAINAKQDSKTPAITSPHCHKTQNKKKQGYSEK